MREEGHLVVICVYGQTPFLNILNVTSQLRENVDVLFTNSGAFVSDALGEKRAKHAEQMEEINQRDPQVQLNWKPTVGTLFGLQPQEIAG